MANKVTNIHVKDSCDAFNVAARFMPGDWEDDRQASARAGYPVYRCYGDGLYYNYICDLGNRLEVNLGDGSTVNVWIDADAEEDFTAAPAAAAAPAVTPAEDSQSGAAAAVDPDLVALRLPRTDVQRVLLAILSVKSKNITEALSLDVDDPRRGACIQYAREWDALRRNIRLQLAGYDARRGCAAAPAARRFSIRTRRGLRMICREKHTRTRGRSFDGSSVVLVQKWDVLRDGSIYARTLQGFFGPARRCGSWSEYVQQQRGYAVSIRREVAALVSICGGEVIA